MKTSIAKIQEMQKNATSEFKEFTLIEQLSGISEVEGFLFSASPEFGVEFEGEFKKAKKEDAYLVGISYWDGNNQLRYQHEDEVRHDSFRFLGCSKVTKSGTFEAYECFYENVDGEIFVEFSDNTAPCAPVLVNINNF